VTRAWNEPWTDEGAVLFAGGVPVAMTAVGDAPDSTQAAYAAHIRRAVNVLAGVHSKALDAAPIGQAVEWLAVWSALPEQAFKHPSGPAAWLAGVTEELRRYRANAGAWTRLYHALRPPSTGGNGEADALAEIERLKALDTHSDSVVHAQHEPIRNTAGSAQPDPH
jgi:hypothetical protein